MRKLAALRSPANVFAVSSVTRTAVHGLVRPDAGAVLRRRTLPAGRGRRPQQVCI